jgi:NAD(P)-dependent dehydrogenase (short-subunit alcohol dehydrogenase family)
LSHIDVLVNNAGLLINKPFKDLTIEDWKLQFAVNLFGMTRLIKLLLPLMGGLKETHIVNLGSMGGFQGSKKFTGLSAYSASKAAVANLTECLAYEFSADNIRVNCLALGAVDTEMLKQAFPGYRAPVTSYEMAEFIKSFCKTGHKLFNGKVLPVSVIDPV